MKKEAARKDNKRTKEATVKGVYDAEEQKRIGGEWNFCKRPDFLKRRNEQFTALYDKQLERYKDLPHDPIKVMCKGKEH